MTARDADWTARGPMKNKEQHLFGLILPVFVRECEDYERKLDMSTVLLIFFEEKIPLDAVRSTRFQMIDSIHSLLVHMDICFSFLPSSVDQNLSITKKKKTTVEPSSTSLNTTFPR